MFESHFWAVYPRRDTTPRIQGNKKVLERKLLKAIKDGETTWEEIKTSLENYALSDKVRKGFIQMPATWVNAQGWTYEYDTPETDTQAAWKAMPEARTLDQWRLIFGRPGPHSRQHWLNNWHPAFGPPPGEPGCQVPAEILHEYGWIRLAQLREKYGRN